MRRGEKTEGFFFDGTFQLSLPSLSSLSLPRVPERSGMKEERVEVGQGGLGDGVEGGESRGIGRGVGEGRRHIPGGGL